MSDRGIEYKPGMDDPKRVSMNRFLPQGVLRAEISYRKPGGLKGTRVVARSEAEFAVLRTAVREGYGEVWRKPEQLSLSEELSQQVINQHAYRCNLCGSMQFFADGYLEHPLPGRAAPEDRPPFG